MNQTVKQTWEPRGHIHRCKNVPNVEDDIRTLQMGQRTSNNRVQPECCGTTTHLCRPKNPPMSYGLLDVGVNTEAKTVSRVPVRGRTAVVNSPWSLTELNMENVDWCVGLQLVIDDKEY